MANPTPEDFSDFLVITEWSSALFVEFRINKKLVSLAVTDTINDGLSSVYTFYDPTMRNRSLGQYAILQQIELAKKMSLQYLYLGYWISQSRKMSYKADYQPLEYYCDRQWILQEQLSNSK